MSENPPEIDVQRRRKGSKPMQQANRPTRPPTPNTSGGNSLPPRPPSGSNLGGGSSGNSGLGGLGSLGGNVLRSGGRRLGCGGIGLIIVVIIIYFVFMRGCGGIELPSFEQVPAGNDGQVYQEPPANLPSRTPFPTPARQAGDPNDTWLVMIYQDADDQALEQDIYIDLNEMERSMASTDQVAVVTQIDRFKGGFSGNDNFHTARRYLVMPDNDLNRIGSDLLMDLGEVNMASGDTLVDFVSWAVQAYPADKYMLIMSDHGMGWPGGWSDPSPATRDGGSAPLISQLPTDSIYLNELDVALAKIQASTGIDKFELIGMDACLMSQLEVYTTLQPYAHYAVASEETEPGLGWAYSAFLSLLVYDPSISTAEVATNIVESYIDQDERITDDQARAEFMQQNSSSSGYFGTSRVSATQLASELEQNITLTAVNLDFLPELLASYNDFAYALQGVNQHAVASARSYTQSYTNIFGRQVPPAYLDLGHFVQIVYKQAGDSNLRPSAQAVLDALSKVVIAERHGRNLPGSTGISIYFPNSQLYQSSAAGMRSYTCLADRFARVSLWDDFLVYHYSNRGFEESAVEAVVPSSGMLTRAPGAGEISISQMSASTTSISTDESVKISANINGSNIGYVYLFVGAYFPDYNSVLVLDTDYLESPASDKLNGVTYPSWPEGESFRSNFEWEPYIFQISDGVTSTPALFKPVSYGTTAADAVYVVEGNYTFSETGETRRAELYFKNEKLFQIFTYLGDETVGAPTEVTPNIGDTFTIIDQWLDLDNSGQVSTVSYLEGETLTFTSSAFTWETVFVWPGDYLVGFQASDLDGASTSAFSQITVR